MATRRDGCTTNEGMGLLLSWTLLSQGRAHGLEFGVNLYY